MPWWRQKAEPFPTVASPEAPALSCPCQGLLLLRSPSPAGLPVSHWTARWPAHQSSRQHSWEQQQEGVGCCSAGAVPLWSGAHMLGTSWQAVPWGWPTCTQHPHTGRAQGTWSPMGEHSAQGVWLSETCLQRDAGQPKARQISQAPWCGLGVSWGTVLHSQRGAGLTELSH